MHATNLPTNGRPDRLEGGILLLVRAFSGGGAQRDAVLLANGLAGRGLRVGVVTLDAAGPLGALVDARVGVADLGQGRRMRMALALPALRRLLAAAKPSAIVGSEAAGNLLVTAAALSLPRSRRPALVLREVASPVLALRSDPYVQNRIAYRLAPWFYPQADRVVALTDGAARELASAFRVPPEKIATLGVNAVLDASTLARLDAGLGLAPRDPGLVVAVGRLSPEKDHATLIDAFARLAQDRPELRLVIAGEGPERPVLERQIADKGLAGRVSLPGFDPDPLALVARAGLFVSSSRYEGFGNAIVEALACGTPIVSTDAPHGPREILGGGEWGTLVPVGDAAALAAAMGAQLARRVDREPSRGRARRFTIDATAEAFAAMLDGAGIGVMYS